jgi:hypothetical protein
MSKLPARALVLSIAVLSGCTTTYVGHKLPVDGALPTDKPSGIPFMMTKPVYTVDIAGDANDPSKPVYTLKATDVPDPTQRYTIALDPALLVDGTYELNFGTLGNVTSAVGQSVSRVVATIESMASFAVNRSAFLANKDMGPVFTQYVSFVTKSDAPACTKKMVRKNKDGTSEELAVQNIIADALNGLKIDAEAELRERDTTKVEDKTSSLAASRYYYQTAEQRACLEAVADEVRASTRKTEQNEKEAYAKTATGAKEDPTLPAPWQQWLTSVDGAVEALDKDSIEKLGKGDLPGPLKSVSGSASTFVKNQITNAQVGQMAEQLGFMPPEVWRSRRFQDIERQLKQRRFAELIKDKDKSKEKRKDKEKGNEKTEPEQPTTPALEEEWAVILGEPKLVQRIAKIDTLLSQVSTAPTGVGNAARNPAAEHVQLREERDKLQERVDRLRSELVAKNKAVDAQPEKKKVDGQTDVQVVLVKPSFIEAVAKSPGTFDKLPPYVVVIRPMPEPAVLANPPTAAK